MPTDTHDGLAGPVNNILDGRAYETVSLYVVPDDLRPGDLVSDGVGAYQIGEVGNYWDDARTPSFVRHIRVAHTLFGPIMGGLMRGNLERVHVVARRRIEG